MEPPRKRRRLSNGAKIVVDGSEFPRIVKLNVGGTIFQSSYDTLKGSPYFQAAFNSGFKDMPQSEAYFIDRDPRFFHYILNFLRNQTIETSCLSPHDRFMLIAEGKYFILDVLVDILRNGDVLEAADGLGPLHIYFSNYSRSYEIFKDPTRLYNRENFQHHFYAQDRESLDILRQYHMDLRSQKVVSWKIVIESENVDVKYHMICGVMRSSDFVTSWDDDLNNFDVIGIENSDSGTVILGYDVQSSTDDDGYEFFGENYEHEDEEYASFNDADMFEAHVTRDQRLHRFFDESLGGSSSPNKSRGDFQIKGSQEINFLMDTRDGILGIRVGDTSYPEFFSFGKFEGEPKYRAFLGLKKLEFPSTSNTTDAFLRLGFRYCSKHSFGKMPKGPIKRSSQNDRSDG